MNVLSTLIAAERPLTRTELSTITGASMAYVTSQLNDLEACYQAVPMHSDRRGDKAKYWVVAGRDFEDFSLVMRKPLTIKTKAAKSVYVEPEANVSRPRTRGDCESIQRPCPFVSCKHNTYLSVSSKSGSLVIRRPWLEPEDVPPKESCTLDIADRCARDGEMLLDEIARIGNETKQSVSKVIDRALRRLAQDHADELVPILEGYDDLAARPRPRTGRFV